MKITAKQSHVLDNLHRIVMRRMASGGFSPHLDGENCRTQVNSLAVKKLIALDRAGVAEKIGSCIATAGDRWGRALI